MNVEGGAFLWPRRARDRRSCEARLLVMAQPARIIVVDALERRDSAAGSRGACRPAPGLRQRRGRSRRSGSGTPFPRPPRPGRAAPARAEALDGAHRRSKAGRLSLIRAMCSPRCSRFAACSPRAGARTSSAKRSPGPGLPDAEILLADRGAGAAHGGVVHEQLRETCPALRPAWAPSPQARGILA